MTIVPAPSRWGVLRRKPDDRILRVSAPAPPSLPPAAPFGLAKPAPKPLPPSPPAAAKKSPALLPAAVVVHAVLSAAGGGPVVDASALMWSLASYSESQLLAEVPAGDLTAVSVAAIRVARTLAIALLATAS